MYLTARFVLSPVLNFDERPVPILNEVNLVVFLENKDRGGLQNQIPELIILTVVCEHTLNKTSEFCPVLRAVYARSGPGEGGGAHA